MEIIVMRLSKRGYRDLRMTTHCCLVARAFGAQKIIVSGDSNKEIEKTVNQINQRFGGGFEVAYSPDQTKEINALKKTHLVVHLTMYGEKLSSGIKKVRQQKPKKVVVVIGAEKVPPAVYHQADYNISVTNQPHSEVAALAVFLHDLNHGREEKTQLTGAKLQIIPQSRGKKVIKTTNE